MKFVISCYLLMFLTGCIITNTPGFYSGYEKLDADAKQNIVFLPSELEICNQENDKRIYAVRAVQLQKCLNENESSIVYFWSPNCSASSCISLMAAQKYCNKNNQKLFVVLEYFDDLEKITVQNVSDLPLLAINHKFYKSDYCNKYTRLFIQELLNQSPIPKTSDRFYEFRFGRLVATRKDLLEEA